MLLHIYARRIFLGYKTRIYATVFTLAVCAYRTVQITQLYGTGGPSRMTSHSILPHLILILSGTLGNHIRDFPQMTPLLGEGRGVGQAKCDGREGVPKVFL